MPSFEPQFTLTAVNGVPQISPRRVLVPMDGVSTVGKSGSGADYAGADTSSIAYEVYNALWPIADANISGGRGAGSTSDFNALKTITFPGKYNLPVNYNNPLVDNAAFYLGIPVQGDS